MPPVLHACLSRPTDAIRIWHIDALVHDILQLRLAFESCSFFVVPRSIRRVADWVAKNCLRDVLPLGWNVCNQPALAKLCSDDPFS